MRSRGAAVATAALVGAVLLLALAGSADACSVCSAGRDDESRWAFIVTTVFLSVLPLGIIGGILFWLRRRARELAHEDDQARAALATGAAPPAAPTLGRISS